MRWTFLSGIRPSFPGLSQSQGQVTHVLLTRSPLIHPASWASSFDLHVLSTPPAFVLSQDQTLHHRPKHQPPPHTQQTVCVQTRGRQTLQELNPNPAPHTHNARKAPDQRNPHPHKPRGQEGAKNHTNPAVKKQPRAVEFSRNNRQPSTNPHGLFPGCGTNPNQDLTENPGSAPVALQL